MIRIVVVVVMAIAACGGDDGGAPSGLCADRPCLTSIDDLADWTDVSVAHAPDARCDFLEETKFLAPATADAALQEIVFQDVGAHRLHLDFMTQVLPEYFGGLAPTRYQAIVQRRATRQYWAGVVYRLVDAGGVTTGYGFDLVVEPTFDEQLTEAEVTAIAAQLATRFHLPLVYAPVGDWAIDGARNFVTLVAHFPRGCQHTQCATPGVDCIVVPAALPVCAHFWEGRTIEIELATKARLTAMSATIELPRAIGTHTVPALFGAGERGPAHAAVTPAAATARYEVAEPTPGFVTRVYLQDFTVGATPYQLRWELPLPDGGGGFVFTDPNVDQHVSMYLGPTGSTSHEELSRLSSCTAATLEPWQIRGAIAGGDGFTIDFRYRPPLAGSGPLFVTRGEVTLDGATAIVDDYFRLVYAGQHHNWDNQFWVLFADPITYDGHPVYGLWLDEQPTTSELEAAHTLDAQHRPLDRLDVASYVVDRAP